MDKAIWTVRTAKLCPKCIKEMEVEYIVYLTHEQQRNKALNEKRIHPTQKPVALYEWLLQKYTKEGWRILDTHLGSGSSRIAAYNLGFEFVGCEIDPTYFQLQEQRFAEHTAQVRMW
jgi:site-specific DNA-methyltransferase (adenine-specific)